MASGLNLCRFAWSSRALFRLGTKRIAPVCLHWHVDVTKALAAALVTLGGQLAAGSRKISMVVRIMRNASRALVLLWFTLQYSLYIDTLILGIVVKESLPCQMCCCRTQSSSFSADRGETGGKNEEAGGKWAECVKKMNVWWFWICEPCTQVHGRARWLSVWIHRVWGDKAALLACHQAATKAALVTIPATTASSIFTSSGCLRPPKTDGRLADWLVPPEDSQ